MKYDPFILQALLLKAANKTGVDLIHKHFTEISERMQRDFPDREAVSARFLYEYLYLKIIKAIQEEEEFLEIRKEEYINLLARFVGYASYQDAWLALKQPISRVLQSCEGDWYFYVRESTGRNYVLRSPIKIWEENHEMRIGLNGKFRWFEGILTYKSGGLFAVLSDEDNEKELHLVFKAGIYRDAEVLRGVFSGFSSEGIPVAGKAFLVRQEEDFGNLEIKKFDIKTKHTDLLELESTILKSLGSFKGNYLRVTALDGFDKEGIGN